MSDGPSQEDGRRSKRSSRDIDYPVVSEYPVPQSPARDAPTTTSLLTMPPSPRDLRLAAREQHKDSIAENQSMDFNNLKDCDRTMFREFVDGKSPLRKVPPERLPKRQKTNPKKTLETSSSEEEPNRKEDGRSRDEVSRNDSVNHRIESVDALARGGLLLRQSDPSEAMKRITNSLLTRANSSDASEDDANPGSSHRRQSRRSGRTSHPPSGSLPRVASRASLGSFGGSVGDLVRFGALGASRSRSLSSSLSLGKNSARDTPPGSGDAFESYKLKMKCPAPRRARQVATYNSNSAHATLSMCSPSPDDGASSSSDAAPLHAPLPLPAYDHENMHESE